MYDSTQLVNDVVSAGLAVSGIVGLVKSGKLNFNAVTNIVNSVEKIAKDVAETPEAATIKAEWEQRLNAAVEDLKKSELGRVAAEALNYTEKDWGQLSDDQKKALIFYVENTLSGKFDITKDEIEKAFELVQSASDKIAELPIVTAADKFTAEQEAMQQAQQVTA